MTDKIRIFQLVSESRWNAYDRMHMGLYNGDKRHYNENDGMSRVFLSGSKQWADNCNSLVAYSYKCLETGKESFMMRTAVADDWEAMCDKLGM